MNIKCEINLKGTCKHCGETFKLWKPFYNHLAFEHNIYINNYYKIKVGIVRFVKNIF